MSYAARATELYRRNEEAGGTLLSKEEEEKLIEVCSFSGHDMPFRAKWLTKFKPYLPRPKNSPEQEHDHTRGRLPTLGFRRFLKSQLHLLIFTIIHTIFSIYIRARQGYHAVRNRLVSIFYYHHRDPAMIQKDVKRLGRLPKILSVILKLDDDGKGGAELERLVNEVSEISAWCASAGIPKLNVYEKTGMCFLVTTPTSADKTTQGYSNNTFPRYIAPSLRI